MHIDFTLTNIGVVADVLSCVWGCVCKIIIVELVLVTIDSISQQIL